MLLVSYTIFGHKNDFNMLVIRNANIDEAKEKQVINTEFFYIEA